MLRNGIASSEMGLQNLEQTIVSLHLSAQRQTQKWDYETQNTTNDRLIAGIRTKTKATTEWYRLSSVGTHSCTARTSSRRW